MNTQAAEIRRLVADKMPDIIGPLNQTQRKRLERWLEPPEQGTGSRDQADLIQALEQAGYREYREDGYEPEDLTARAVLSSQTEETDGLIQQARAVLIFMSSSDHTDPIVRRACQIVLGLLDQMTAWNKALEALQAALPA